MCLYNVTYLSYLAMELLVIGVLCIFRYTCLVLQTNQSDLVLFSLWKIQDGYLESLSVGHYKDWEPFHVILMSLLQIILFYCLVAVYHHCIFLSIWSSGVWSETSWYYYVLMWFWGIQVRHTSFFDLFT